MPHKLILNKGGEEQVHEFANIEGAFDAAVPWVMEGYIARITDEQGIVKYTQAAADGQITTHRGEGVFKRGGSGPPIGGTSTLGARKSWWRFW